MIKNAKGYSTVEFIFVLGLLLLFTFGSLLLIKDGSNLYQRMTDTKEIQTDIRIASAFITNKMRQNDVQDAIRIETLDNGITALVLTEKISGVSYDTWVFSMDGYLKEALVQSNQKVNVNESFDIVKLTKMNVKMLENETVHVELMGLGETSIEMVYKIKSGK